MRFFCLTIFCLLLGSPQAFSGEERGNGGDALVCFDRSGSVSSVEFFDLYETRVIRKWTPDLGSGQLSIEEKVLLVLERMKGINPSRYDRYVEWLDTFYSETEILQDIDLVDIPDTGDGYIPENCEIQQLIIQRKTLLPGEKRFTIDGNLWSKLDSDSKAAAILHELIYREIINAHEGDMTSRFARYYHSLLLSNNSTLLNYKEYLEMMQFLKFPTADLHIAGILVNFHAHKGRPLEYHSNTDFVKMASITSGSISVDGASYDLVDKVHFHSDGSVKWFSSNSKNTVRIDNLGATAVVNPGKETTLQYRLEGGKFVEVRAIGQGSFASIKTLSSQYTGMFDGAIDFSGDEGVVAYHARISSLNSDSVKVQVGGREILAQSGSTFEEYLNGNPKRLRMVTRSEVWQQLEVQGKMVTFSNVVHFHSNGVVSKGHIYKGVSLRTTSGQMKKYGYTTGVLQFNEQGLVID